MSPGKRPAGQEERFFTDSQYVEIRARLFEKTVEGTAINAEYGS